MQFRFPRLSAISSESLYAYTLNHPVVYNDPTGMDASGCDRSFPQCLQTPPVRHCCDLHDNCYFVHDCRSRSWWHDTVFTPCSRRNLAVVWCLTWATLWPSDPVVPRNIRNPYPAEYNQ
jgi:hypothetical protein